MKFPALDGITLIGLAGNIGSGKSAAAGMIPGAHHVQWADPIYRGLAAMLDIPEDVLRDPAAKGDALSHATLNVVPRNLLRTLGTEWGRELVHPDIWVRLTVARIAKVHACTGRDVFAICGTRFANEMTTVRDNGGEVWWIDRPGTEQGPHTSDRTLVREQCDRVLVNDGTMDQLRQRVLGAWLAYTGRMPCRAG